MHIIYLYLSVNRNIMKPQSIIGNIFSILVFIKILSAFLALQVSSQVLTCPINSIYQLGDSISDTGNLIRMMPTAPASRPPYGETFPGRPTGRWSDGRLIIDYIANALGLPLLNPYLDRNASFQNGVNFAVSGSTTLSFLFFALRGIITSARPSLRTQLQQFQSYIATICSTPSECRQKLNNSLVFVGEFGYNDISFAYAEGRSLDTIQSYLLEVNRVIINSTRDVILAGVPQVIVPLLFPLGCFPLFLDVARKNATTTYDSNGCVKDLNDAIASRNNDLRRDIITLRGELPNATILYSDLYNGFLSILRDAPALGFNTSTLLKACCGTEGNYNSLGPVFCGNGNVPVCPNPNTYINWDGIHLTQEAYRYIANIIIRDLGINCTN
ncbi:acetylajmalan esterase-like [Andrographis paniculata]|uniref:acetylajmalan esterase-like n=1 Tax=Andrographis paniculata TaxID=175694 RepID=UPI0021E96A24|nr:acetylajmalan esterase-like [Andrographis paniculata]